ncbi:MAG: hypothetical protein AAF390_04605, partial [Pseudomonadota bacterium]
GHGRALLAAVGRDVPMTALVLEGNARACAFYAAAGAVVLDTLPCRIGAATTREHVYAWPQGPRETSLTPSIKRIRTPDQNS